MVITNTKEGCDNKPNASYLGLCIGLGVGVGGAISFGAGDQAWIALGAPFGVVLYGIVTFVRG